MLSLNMRRRFYISAAVIVAGLLASYVAVRVLLPQSAFRDCSDCPLLVSISGADFLMGIPRSEQIRELDTLPDDLRETLLNQYPQHQATVSRFALSAHDVTRGEFELFVRETRYRVPSQLYRRL